MEENQNPTVSTENTAVVAVKRPWQGTTLAVFGIIALVLLGIMIPMIFMGAGLLATMLPGTLGGMTMVFGLVFLGIWVLELFVVIGLFKGQKWVIILSIVFSVLALLGGFYPKFSILTLLLNAFMLYLEYVCLKHPFYNKK